ncbi:rab11 family-interacting protein 2 [Periplaneta americana]|uniref:rab11 family-interacting protein 2 n=1 Tax=Periplaneta americana TaxID=6978 RepID=UPI0037E859A9
MWSPTHVQVTVQRARGLLTKGKHGTNDAFVTIALGKEKYQTSVKEKASQDVEWHEECELQIPKQGNVAEIILTAVHRNFLGVDEFLGVVNIPLADFDVYERPKNRWYELKSKPGKEKNKRRGELEVRVSFLVKAGSLTDLSKKHRSSLGQLSHMAHSVGGSLLSIGSIEKRKGITSLAKSMVRKSKKGKKDNDETSQQGFRTSYPMSAQVRGDSDPGVISEGESEDDFTLDDLSHKSSGSSLNANQPSFTPVAGSLENLAGGEFLRRTSTMQTSTFPPPVKPPRSSSAPQDKSVIDEWEEKLYGKHGKDVHAPTLDTPIRRSWENPKSLLAIQPEEEESDNVEGAEAVTQQSSQAVAELPIPALRQEVPEKEKKEGSKLVRKFKQLRRDSKLSDLSHTASSTEQKHPAEERIIIGGELTPPSRLSPDIIKKFEGKSKEDLIEMICSLQLAMENQTKKLKDLEDYLDNLLLRVMETTPRILQNPYVSCKTQAKLSHH